jgi:glycosyltransferase involved in cell wall biosynthesis
MIVKDEAKWLEKSIASARSVVDEVIVVDTGSADGTPGIAEKLGARVFSYKWDNNFSNARNFAIKQATGEWILSLDADETIAEKDLAAVKSLAKNRHFDGFSFIIRNYTNNEFLSNFVPRKNDDYAESEGFRGYDSVRMVRMFRNSGILFEREIHEVVEHSIRRLGGKILEVNIPIHHFGELKGKGISGSKLQKYKELSGARLAANPNDPKSNFDLGYFHFQRGEYEKAIEHYKKAIQLKPDYVDAFFGLGEIYASQERYEEAVGANRKILGISPKNAAACYNLGELYMGLKRYREAEEMYKKALELNSPHRERIIQVLEKIRKHT